MCAEHGREERSWFPEPQILSQIIPVFCDEFRWKVIHWVPDINIYLSKLCIGEYIRLFLRGWLDNQKQTRTQIFLSPFPDVAHSNSPARTISVDVGFPWIIQKCSFDGGAWGFALYARFTNAQFHVHQISSLCMSGVDKLRRWISTMSIAQIFDLQRKNVRHTLTDSDTIWKGHEDHSQIDDGIYTRLLEEITKNVQNRASVN
jgi:hypothetical protein